MKNVDYKVCRIWDQKLSPLSHSPPLKTEAKASLRLYIVGAPMDRKATDNIENFPTSDSGSKYILVVKGQFSKWVEVYAIKDQTAKTVARVLVHEFFSRFGVPLE